MSFLVDHSGVASWFCHLSWKGSSQYKCELCEYQVTSCFNYSWKYFKGLDQQVASCYIWIYVTIHKLMGNKNSKKKTSPIRTTIIWEKYINAFTVGRLHSCSALMQANLWSQDKKKHRRITHENIYFFSLQYQRSI